MGRDQPSAEGCGGDDGRPRPPPPPTGAARGERWRAAGRSPVGAEAMLSLMEVGGSLLERVAVGNPLSLVLAASAFALSLGYLFQLGYRRHVGSDQRVGAEGGAVPQATGGGAGGRRWAGAGQPSSRGGVVTAGRTQGRGRGSGGAGSAPVRLRTDGRTSDALAPGQPFVGSAEKWGCKIQACGGAGCGERGAFPSASPGTVSDGKVAAAAGAFAQRGGTHEAEVVGFGRGQGPARSRLISAA